MADIAREDNWLIGSCECAAAKLKIFEGPEAGWVPTFGGTRPNPSPQAPCGSVSLERFDLGKSDPLWPVVGDQLLVFLLVFLIFAPEIHSVNQCSRL